MLYIKEDETSIKFKVYILPKSSKNMISGLYGDALKIKLTAPPVEGAANRLCIKFIAKTLNVSRAYLEIVSGHTGRKKIISLKYPEFIKTKEERLIQRDRILSLGKKKT